MAALVADPATPDPAVDATRVPAWAAAQPGPRVPALKGVALPMHEKARRRIVDALLDVRNRRSKDALLDELYDAMTRATNWDADQWGFDPNRWMAKERLELASRGGANWPIEPAIVVCREKHDAAQQVADSAQEQPDDIRPETGPDLPGRSA